MRWPSCAPNALLGPTLEETPQGSFCECGMLQKAARRCLCLYAHCTSSAAAAKSRMLSVSVGKSTYVQSARGDY